MTSQTITDEPASVRGTALLTKALDILEFVGEGGKRPKFKDIADHTGHTRSTLYRILSALMSRGMLDLDKRDQSYVLGPKFTTMAGSINQNSDLIARASGPLRELADTYGESINLGVLNGSLPVTVARWQGSGAQPFSSPLGENKPLHATGLGKALLAFSSNDAREELLRHVDYNRFTNRTITTPTALDADLSITRARGFALDDNEILDGVVCVAAPIYGPDGNVVAAASFNCPSHRMEPKRRAELASIIQSVTRDISRELAVRNVGPGLDRQVSRNVRVLDVKAFQVRNLYWNMEQDALYWIDSAGGSLNRQKHGRREVVELFPGPVQAMAHGSSEIYLVNANQLWRIDPSTDTGPVQILENPALASVVQIHLLKGGAFLLIGPDGLAVLAADGTVRNVRSFDGRPVFSHVTTEGKLAMSSEDGSALTVMQLRPQGGIEHTERVLLDRHAPGVAALHLGGDGTFSLSQNDGWAVWQYDRTGKVSKSIPLPVPTAASLCEGESPAVIYAGSDRLPLTYNQLRLAPLAGGIFRIEIGA